MRAIVLTTDQPNQLALVARLSGVCDIAGVILSRNVPRRPPARRVKRFANRVAGRTVGSPLTKASGTAGPSLSSRTLPSLRSRT
jgi:hypothetical protein